MTTTGIPTVFDVTQYRSRLEARWAAFFDLIGWSYVYEPFDGAGYIPDFMVTIPGRKDPVLIEVKPAATYDEYQAAVQKAYRALPDWKHAVLVLGVNPYYENPWNFTAGEGYTRDVSGGLLPPGKTACPTAVWWVRSGTAITLRASYMKTGCVTGPHVECSELDKWWREAGNKVQWRSPANNARGNTSGA